MASPRTVIHISEANGSIKRLTDGIAFIDQEADTRNIHLTGTLLSSFQKSLGYTFATVFGKNCQRVKIQFTCLRLVIHPGMVFAKMNHSSLDEGTGFLRPGELTHVLWSMIPETLAFAPLGIGIVPYTLPGSVELADATLEQIRHYDVVLWEKHGTVAVGRDIMDAFDQTDVLCKAAKIYMCAKAMGSEPEGMTDEAMQEVQRVFNLPKERIG